MHLCLTPKGILCTSGWNTKSHNRKYLMFNKLGMRMGFKIWMQRTSETCLYFKKKCITNPLEEMSSKFKMEAIQLKMSISILLQFACEYFHFLTVHWHMFLNGKIYKPQEYQGLKSKPGMWKRRQEQHITMTQPSPMWMYRRRVTLQGALGLVVRQERAALSGLSAFSHDPLVKQQGCSVVSLSQRFT